MSDLETYLTRCYALLLEVPADGISATEEEHCTCVKLMKREEENH